ncbi:hypothetical protein BDR05DRAFT_945862 [Suillus weaverae]|nr:hypothetical protein BDR05DRAFT_945862 [Suillus weaverae]
MVKSSGFERWLDFNSQDNTLLAGRKFLWLNGTMEYLDKIRRGIVKQVVAWVLECAKSTSASYLGEAKQDEQRDSGRTEPHRPHRINITLPPPQRNAQMYGYHISQKWLDETAFFFLAKLHPDISETKARTNAQANPSYSFRKTFHIQSITTSYAILPPGQIVPAECIVNGAVLVLYIFNDQSESYRRRPTQKQVDELTRFMGREPQWWVDVLPARRNHGEAGLGVMLDVACII